MNKENPSRKNSNKEGKEFEDMLTRQFNKYRKEGRMYCIKVPTEVVILRRGAKIVSAFPRAKSEALDYLGILSTGECVTFEAKSSNNKTSFPLSQIKEYQFELHKEIRNYTRLVFYIIRMKSLGRFFLVTSDEIDEFMNTSERKSIPVSMLGDSIGVEMQDLDILKYLKL